jgi:RHS repeat-associated protein
MDDGRVTQYEYDGDGNRISKTANGVKTNYINDVGLPLVQVLFETDVDDNVLASYTYGNDLISMKRLGENSYYHYDGLGSVRQLTDDTQTVVASYIYDAFGNVISQTTGGGMAYNTVKDEPINKAGLVLLVCFVSGLGIVTVKNKKGGLITILSIALLTVSIPTSTAVEADATGNPYGFTGESQFGEADDLIYLRARYYSPSIGRFISRDPILEPMRVGDRFVWVLPYLTSHSQILNPYVHVCNNPVNWTDPTGEIAVVVVLVIFAVLIAAPILTLNHCESDVPLHIIKEELKDIKEHYEEQEEQLEQLFEKK